MLARERVLELRRDSYISTFYGNAIQCHWTFVNYASPSVRVVSLNPLVVTLEICYFTMQFVVESFTSSATKYATTCGTPTRESKLLNNIVSS